MASQPTHYVDHKNLVLRVNDELVKMKQGAPLTLTAAQAKLMGSRVSAIKSDSVDLSKEQKATK